MIPKILMVTEDGFSGDVGHYVINRAYGDAIAKAGGLPIVGYDVTTIEDYVDQFDGLFLTGGPDPHAYWYGEYYRDFAEMKPFSRTRDDLDFALCKAFLARKKPIFGVGRGMSVINIALGGKIYKDIKAETGREHPEGATAFGYGVNLEHFYAHDVKVVEGTKLAKVLGNGGKVNSCHHQSVKFLGEGLRIAATAPDGVIEAVEHESLPVFGVMWHPEREGAGVPADDRPFEYFVSLCK